jgi:hypothetical protein
MLNVSSPTQELLEFSLFFVRHRGRNDIARDGTLTRHEIVDVTVVHVDGHELRRWLPALRDDHSLPLNLNLIHHSEAMFLKKLAVIFFISKSLTTL